MKIWDKLSQVNINNKEKFQIIFSKIFNEIKNNKFSLDIGEFKKEDYYLVIEEDRANSYFIHIIPNQVYALFKEMQIKAPNEFLGFSVIAGKYKNKVIRLSCFGVQCNLLGKSLFKT